MEEPRYRKLQGGTEICFKENIEFLFDRFESQDLCAIVELDKLLNILQLAHELLSRDLSIDSFNLMLSDDPLAEKAKIDAATVGAPELRPRSFRGQLQQFEQCVTHRLDQLDARLDTLDGYLDQQTALLAQILSLLQMQPPPPPESQ
ncbi:hypothetical protein ACSBR2_015764 [Camellia fascicularis]